MHGPTLVNPADFTLGQSIGTGAFGSVHHCKVCTDTGTMLCVAKRAKQKDLRAAQCLESEARLDQILHEAAPASRYLAPLRGVCKSAGVNYLIWDACGTRTLHSYLEQPGQLPALGRALGLIDPHDHAALAHATLHELLSSLAVIHKSHVVHRDIKPENLLVDRQTHGLRLIDLGAACKLEECEIGPSSVLYAPPEQALGQRGEVCETYDVYSVALVWLQVLLGASRRQMESLRPLVEKALFADEKPSALPRALSSDFAGGDQEVLSIFTRDEDWGRAWELLQRMMARDPHHRITAAEALAGPYHTWIAP